MSVGATPSLNFIGDTVGDVAPHAMSEMRGIRFATGNSPTTGAISLSDFRNQVITASWTEQAKIQASDKESGDWFGRYVALSADGNTVIVSAYLEDTGGFNAGAAYIFTRSGATWTEQAKIQASDREAFDWFGRSVSISSDGNTAIVGAPTEDTGGDAVGAAYIFTRSGTTWTEQAKIQASDKQAVDYFGQSAALSSDGNTALVAAHGEDTGGDTAGAVYIFTRSGATWTQQAKIQASDKQAGDWFGQAAALSADGNTALVGAYAEDTGGTNTGAAYIFTRSGATWTEQVKIQASDKQAGDVFGISVAISGDGNTALVGAQSEDTGASDAGAAYIFTRSGATWTEQAKIQASDKQANDWFGFTTALSGDGNTAIVGAIYDDDTGATDAGAAYIFTRSGATWTQQAKIELSDKQANDRFGHAVSISSDGNTVIVGRDDDTGSAYIYNFTYFV